MAFTASCKWLLSRRQEHRADSNNIYRPYVAASDTTLNPKHTKGKGPFVGVACSSLVPQVIYEFSFRIPNFMISELMCKFMTGWFKS